MINKWREPVNALTHLLGLIVFIPILIVLLFDGYARGGIFYLVPLLIFAISVVLLYSASTIYHMVNASERMIKILKRIDHMMIFVLIAGTYTPICLITLNNSSGNILLTFVWCIGIIGIILKIFWINAPRWISTLFYVLMGWSAIFGIYPISEAVSKSGLTLLISGGIVYSIGALIYATKFPNLKIKYLGFHEIFHIFVMGGSACFIAFMFLYVI